MASIRKLPSGKYQAQFRPIPGGKQITKTSDRRADVQRWLDEQTASRVTGTFVDPRAGKTTLASFYDVWSQRQVWETGTRRAVDQAIRSTTFKDEQLQRITTARVEEWVKGMQKQGLAPGTIKTRVMNVRTVLRGAIADKMITADPALGVTLPRARKKAAAMAIPSPPQVRQMLERASDRYQPLFAVAAFAGLRLGEASALQLGDIDFLKRVIYVRRQAQRGDGILEIRLPKYGSERDVPVPQALLDVLAAHATFWGLTGEPSAWLFPSDHGEPSAPTSVNTAWQVARANLPFTLHDLRHFYASGLIAAGCDVVTVQSALGHSKPSITLDTYSHLWPQAEDRTRTAAAGIFTSVFGAADELLTNERQTAQ